MLEYESREQELATFAERGQVMEHGFYEPYGSWVDLEYVAW